MAGTAATEKTERPSGLLRRLLAIGLAGALAVIAAYPIGAILVAACTPACP